MDHHGKPAASAAQMDAGAIVVGSGFGGAVAAARLAQAGFSVLVLERGRRWHAGTFPREPRLEAGWLWQLEQGLYEIRWLGRMASVHGAGWGGGSLVYANVFARPYDAALDPRWPRHLRRHALDPYYDLTAHMLGVGPVADDPRTGRPPARTSIMEHLVDDMGIAPGTVRPNVAVTFGETERWRPNRHGAARRGCAFVGECVLGCNHGAKNTLDVTYLHAAEKAGARGVTDTEVRRIEQVEGGYRVIATRPSDPRSPDRAWQAPRLVLAAGAVATTELLLRARDLDRTLLDLSPRLGEGFSGNGDFLTLGELPQPPGDMTTGPTITTTTVLDVPEGRTTVWFQVQDGAYPVPLRDLADAVLPARRLRALVRRWRKTDPRHGFAVLAMGKDSAGGRLHLGRNGRARLRWRNRWQGHLYRSQRRVGPLLARELRARLYNPVTWSVLRRTVTVHPLGGVPVGPDKASGVVDEAGEVHGYPGLSVMDGSVLPAATGVNPSATILAVAERSIENAIRRSGREQWRAPEWAEVKPVPVPEDAAFAYRAGVRAATAGDGVTFDEQMRSRPGRRPHVTMSLHADLPSLDRFLADPDHTIAMDGHIDIDGLAVGAAISGTLSLFPDGRAVAMRYDLHFEDDGGRPWHLSGSKSVRRRTPAGLLTGLTRLHTEIGPDDGGTGGGRVRLEISASGVVGLLRSIRGVGFTRLRRVRAVARFGAFFVASARRRPREAA